MQALTLTLNQMLTLASIVVLGYLLRKHNILHASAAGVLANLETWFFMPCITLGNLMVKCTPDNLKENYPIFFLGVAMLLLAVLISGPASKLFARDGFDRQVFRYSIVVPNYGYLGISLVLDLLGADYLFLYSMFDLPFTFFVYTLGMLWLDPTRGSGVSVKKLLNPAFLALPAGMLLGLTGVQLPAFLIKAFDYGAGCMAPVAMLIMGITIGDFNFRTLLRDKRVYAMTFVRLLLMPVIVYSVLTMIGLKQEFVTIATVFTSLPLGLNAVVFPAAKSDNVEYLHLGAGMALISNSLAVITFPLIFALCVH